MRAELQLPRSTRVYELALEGLSRVNEYLYKTRKLPSIYAGGVRYQREAGEVWRHAADVLGDGWGDCEDLAAARVGELRAGGEAGARVAVVRTGPRMTHAIVIRADGRSEDPSKRLGMGKPGGGGGGGGAPPEDESDEDDMHNRDDDDNEEIGADVSTSPEVTWTCERTPNGWRGVVRVPLEMGRMLVVKRPGKSKEGAASTALAAASKILDNPAVAAVLPGQARFALNLVRSPKARKLAKSIMGLF